MVQWTQLSEEFKKELDEVVEQTATALIEDFELFEDEKTLKLACQYVATKLLFKAETLDKEES